MFLLVMLYDALTGIYSRMGVHHELYYAKIYDKNTEIKEDNVTGTEATGVSIDVFPVDGLGNTRREAVKAFKATAFRRELLGAAQWKKFFRSKTHAW